MVINKKETVVMSEKRVEGHVNDLEAAYAATHGGKVEAQAWLDAQVRAARREPQSFRHLLEEEMGEEGAADLYARARGPQREDAAMG